MSGATATLQALDGAAVRRWCATGRQALYAARVEIDDLNVYPVPDGDTGTNLLLTMEAVARAVEQVPSGQPDELPAVLSAMARGALMGARGNSGVILSQLLRGLADGLVQDTSGGGLARALDGSATLARAAVVTPEEGTVLTVARDAADAALACAGLPPSEGPKWAGGAGSTGIGGSQGADGLLSHVVHAARAAAAESLRRTQHRLPALAAAGVVDAGGRGWCVLLEALERVVSGRPAVGVLRLEPELLVPRSRAGLAAAREAGSPEFGYEVQYLLRDTGVAAAQVLRDTLAALGDSVVVVGGPDLPGHGPDAPVGGELYNVHVHVNDVGAAVEAGLDAGRPFRVTVTRFLEQFEPAVAAPALRVGRALVAVAAGQGLAGLLSEAGALVVAGGPGACPSSEALLQAILSAGTAEVVLLPNDRDAVSLASAAAALAREHGVAIAVVPTRSVLQGLAAVAVADPSRPFADDAANMAEAAGSTRYAEVTVAVREAATSAGICRPGDVLGLLEGDVVLIGSDVEQVGQALLRRLLDAGGELVTVVTGAGAAAGLGERLVGWVERHAPLAEAARYDGGQEHSPLLIGVE